MDAKKLFFSFPTKVGVLCIYGNKKQGFVSRTVQNAWKRGWLDTAKARSVFVPCLCLMEYWCLFPHYFKPSEAFTCEVTSVLRVVLM